MPRRRRSEEILFPLQIDSFPSLVDQFSSGNPDDSILFAEDYNKVRNLLLKISDTWITASNTASGDTTLTGISYAFTMHAKLRRIINSVEKHVWYGNRNAPGNVLPFEFVITSSNDYYDEWWLGSDLIIQDTADVIKSITAGLDFFNIYPMITTSISISSLHNLHPTIDTSRFLVNAQSEIDEDTLVVRGLIIDLDMANDSGNDWQNSTNRWRELAETYALRMSIVGVRT